MYNTASWQALAPNVYDADGKIVFIQRPFLTSGLATFIGALCILSSAVSSGALYFSLRELSPIFIISVVELSFGLFLVSSSLKAKRTREENAGIHPKDILYFLDRNNDEIRKQTGDVEERLAKLSESNLTIKTDRTGKHDSHHVELHLPNNVKVQLFVSANYAVATKLFNEIRTRLDITAPSSST